MSDHAAVTAKAVEQLKMLFADEIVAVETSAGQPWVGVKRGRIRDLMMFLHDDPAASFDTLVDLCGADLMNQGAPERYAVVYHLGSSTTDAILRIKAYVPEDDPSIDSIHDLWRSAPWAEREAHDMYGIVFKGNPDLRRILLPEYYTGYPLRKDYPLIGMGERDAFPRYSQEEAKP